MHKPRGKGFLGSGHYLWPGWGLKRKYYVPLKIFYSTICLGQVFFTAPKENSKRRLHLCLNMINVFALPLCYKTILLLHPAQLTVFSYPTVLSSVPAPVIYNDRSLRRIFTGTSVPRLSIEHLKSFLASVLFQISKCAIKIKVLLRNY